MTAGFMIWSAVALLIAGIGVWTWRSKEPAGFFAGVEAPKVTDVRKYNRAVACLWFVYAALFGLLGVPLLFLSRNAAAFLLPVLGTAAISIGLMIVYNRILNKYRQQEGKPS